ncbi:1,4-alpha-glucan branching protein domain-containing protein [Paenibacillus chitinolyticus]|uniref:1,4-alpha-glucan branching protein domain-containing protein n=1 Tax=Paenibacillus chitinolyticus TaxID=79263 RepID=UPI00366D7FA9
MSVSQPVPALLVFHAHLPYVYRPDGGLTLEEYWFHEAMCDVYLPFADCMDRLLNGKVCSPVTLSVSPVLLSMWENPDLQQRTREILKRRVELGRKEQERLADKPGPASLASRYTGRYADMLALFDKIDGKIIPRLRLYADRGLIQLIPAAATHPFLPLFKTEEAAFAQLYTAVTEFRRYFGFAPSGIWLPECGYTPMLEPILLRLGLRFTILEAPEDKAGDSGQGPAAPYVTPDGLRVFTRDAAASALVWSRDSGYPGHPDYREYYRDIGYELGRGTPAEQAYIRPYVLPDGTPAATGYKYCRITGATGGADEAGGKAPYDADRAAELAAVHARHFLASLGAAEPAGSEAATGGAAVDAAGSAADWAAAVPTAQAAAGLASPASAAAKCQPAEAPPASAPAGDAARQTRAELSDAQLRYDGQASCAAPEAEPVRLSASYAGESGARPQAASVSEARLLPPRPVAVCAFDLELFGHWWHEGPLWLETLLREGDREQRRRYTASGSHSGPSLPDSEKQPVFLTPSLYEERYAFGKGTAPVLSSWGRGGDARVWLNPATDWMYPLLHAAEEAMALAAARAARTDTAARKAHQALNVELDAISSSDPFSFYSSGPGPNRRDDENLSHTAITDRILRQAARELMLAQSSDWAFMIEAGEMAGYAAGRFHEHRNNFYQLLPILDDIDERQPAVLSPEKLELLHRMERSASLFPDVNWRAYLTGYLSETLAGKKRSQAPASALAAPLLEEQTAAQESETGKPSAGSSQAKPPAANSFTTGPNTGKKTSLRVLVLAWEFPPHLIGGLGRAVGDLTAQLARDGHTVHVITCRRDDEASDSLWNGVHIHRVEVLQSSESPAFLDWVFRLNIAMILRVERLLEENQELRFDILHAHDWLVYYAARDCRQALRLPLVATLHATEHGRKLGRLDDPVSRKIHAAESSLAELADKLIVCSDSMAEEVTSLFNLKKSGVTVIPNGLPAASDAESSRKPHPAPACAGDSGRTLRSAFAKRRILYLGRLVPEKNVPLLLAAFPYVLEQFPETELVIAGTGPEAASLSGLAAPFGDRVRFTGFADEAAKAGLLAEADVCAIPSLYEPFGIVALEAMRAGVPLVAADTGGLAGLVEDGIDGFRLPPTDPLAWAGKICLLLGDPELAALFTKRASAKLHTCFNMKEIGAATANVYQSAINCQRSTKTC